MSDPQTRYFRVGLFVLVGAFLVGTCAVMLGGRDFFARRLLFETYFSEPVTGLEVGSPVRYRGVKIGVVKSIGFVEEYYHFDSDENRYKYGQLVSVLMERIYEEGEETGLTELSPEEQRERLREQVERGLRLRLAYSGITGTAFIQADVLDPKQNPPMKVPWTPRHLYVPSAPSTIAQLTSAAERFAAKLDNVDLAKIVDDIDEMVVTLTETARGLDVSEVNREAVALLSELRDTNREFEKALGQVDLAGLGEEARQALTEANATLVRTRHIVEGGRYDLEMALENLRVTTENLRDLTETLKGQPSLLLRGEAPARSEVQVEEVGP